MMPYANSKNYRSFFARVHASLSLVEIEEVLGLSIKPLRQNPDKQLELTVLSLASAFQEA